MNFDFIFYIVLFFVTDHNWSVYRDVNSWKSTMLMVRFLIWLLQKIRVHSKSFVYTLVMIVFFYVEIRSQRVVVWIVHIFCFTQLSFIKVSMIFFPVAADPFFFGFYFLLQSKKWFKLNIGIRNSKQLYALFLILKNKWMPNLTPFFDWIYTKSHSAGKIII